MKKSKKIKDSKRSQTTGRTPGESANKHLASNETILNYLSTVSSLSTILYPNVLASLSFLFGESDMILSIVAMILMP